MPDPYREPIKESKLIEAAPEVKQPEQAEGRLAEVLELEKKLAEKKAALGLAPETPIIEIQSAASEEAQGLKDIKDIEESQQVKALIDLAFNKGVMQATEVARHLDNPHLVDDFHRTLIKLYNELVDKGKLEEI